MPVKINRTILVKSSDSTIALSEEELKKAATETAVTITCSSSRCASRHDADGPKSISWTEEAIASDVSKLPDDFFEFMSLRIHTTPVTEVAICGPQCLKDFMAYDFVPPKSVRKIIEEQKAKQAEQLKELNPHLVQPVINAQAEYHTPNIPAQLPNHSGAVLKVVSPQEQADGYSGDDAVVI